MKSSSMVCPCCNVNMEERTGKFGKFFYCKYHGTLSVQHGRVVCTGEIFKKTSRQPTHRVRTTSETDVDLDFLVRRKIMGFGVEMTELDLFVEGGVDAAEDEEDHWMNVRPY